MLATRMAGKSPGLSPNGPVPVKTSDMKERTKPRLFQSPMRNLRTSCWEQKANSFPSRLIRVASFSRQGFANHLCNRKHLGQHAYGKRGMSWDTFRGFLTLGRYKPVRCVRMSFCDNAVVRVRRRRAAAHFPRLPGCSRPHREVFNEQLSYPCRPNVGPEFRGPS